MVGQAPRRLASLDGLRGLAAVVVLLHHSLLIVPSLSAVYFGGYQPASTAVAWLAYSPLHLAWEGTEAVYLFFVLSGFVLARAANRVDFDWFAYFPSRLVRLYAPVGAAVLLAALFILLVPRTGTSGSQWVNLHPPGYPPQGILLDLTLVTGVYGTTPLWSLQWEVLFSLLLPVVLILAARRRPALALVLSIAVSTAGFYFVAPFLMFMPMFAIGVAVSKLWERIAIVTERISAVRFGHLAWLAILIGALLFTTSYWLMVPHLSVLRATLLSRPLILVGVTVLLVVAASWIPARRLLSIPPIAWLGRISFSLYLVHEPVVVSMAYLLPGTHWAIAAAIVAALALAVLFFVVVERPSHRLSQRIRSGFESRDRVPA
jgi:peptidoglycan/LPS O-acetylase OafA/YrhL